MPTLLPRLETGARALLVVAAPQEARAVLRGLRGAAGGAEAPAPWRAAPVGDQFDVLLTGVGKANAAGAVSRVFRAERHRIVLNLGVAGSLPWEEGGSHLPIGSVVLGTESVYADEGAIAPARFHDLDDMGFPPGPGRGVSVRGDEGLLAEFRSTTTVSGPIATVSTCSGTDSAAADIARRTGAIAEAMEGAAIGFTLQWIAAAEGAPMPPFLEIRVISNATGDRNLQKWDIKSALAGLSTVAAAL